MQFESTKEIQDLLDKTTSVENRLLTILYLLNGKFTELQTVSEKLKTSFQASQPPAALATVKNETKMS